MAVTIDGVGEINGVVLPTTGFGKILQVVRATDVTDRTTTSGSFVDASISVTITPQKSTSAIIVIWSFQALTLGSGTKSIYQITDNTNSALSGSEGSELAGGGTNLKTQIKLLGYDAPATTSPTTYKGRFKAGSGTAYAQNTLSTGQLYAIEVAA